MTAYENWIMKTANNSPNPHVTIKVILANDLFNQNPQAYKLMEEAKETIFTPQAFDNVANYLIQKSKDASKNS
jgi:hypothetical protein